MPFQKTRTDTFVDRSATFGLVLLSLILYLALCTQLGYGLVDDSFISLRYADNAAHDKGLVFNPGEYVEGYSSFFHTVLLAVAIRAGLTGSSVAAGLGVASGIGVILATFLIARRVSRGTDFQASTVCAYLAISIPFISYSVSGLETTTFALLLVLSIYMFLRGFDAPTWHCGSAMALGVATLTRPESPAFVLYNLLALSVLVRRRSSVTWTRVASYTVGYALITGSYYLWRHSYYGFWLPNTYYAKVGHLSWSLAGAGFHYVCVYLFTSLLLLIVIPGLIVTRSLRSNGPLMYVAGFLAIQLTTVVLEGGDHFPMVRFCVPAIPLVAILCEELGCAVASRVGRRFAKYSAARVGNLATVLFVCFMGAASSALIAHTDHERFLREVRLTEDWAGFGKWLRLHADPTASIALLPIGAVGYYSGLPVIDMAGLTDLHIAHLPVPTGIGYIGHEKFDSQYVLDRRPTFLLASHFVRFWSPLSEDAYDELAMFPVLRELVANPALDQLYEYKTAAAPNGGFYGYYERRDRPSAE